MSREIKFRAYHKKEKRFYYFDIETCTNTYYVGYYRSCTEEDSWKDCELSDSTLYEEKQLYIGLLDKNSTPIYKGDILLIADEWTDRALGDGVTYREPCNHLAPVVFDPIGGFGVEIKHGADIFSSGYHSFENVVNETGEAVFEIVGNIYSNPELLEAK